MSDLLSTTAHLLAGNALFTARHPASGERYTYHVATKKNGREKGLTVAKLLTGPNNTGDYTRLGLVDADTGELDLDASVGTNGKTVPTSVALLRWLLARAAKGEAVPEGIEIHHAGCCLKCGRTLTVPVSDNAYRAFGLGPECGPQLMGRL